MPTRAVTIMCLVQVGLLILTWMLTSKFVHFAEKTWKTNDFMAGLETPFFPWLQGYLRWGLFLLTVPVGIAVFSTALTVTHRDITIVGDGGFRLSMLATLLVLAFSFFTTWNAFKAARGPQIGTVIQRN